MRLSALILSALFILPATAYAEEAATTEESPPAVEAPVVAVEQKSDESAAADVKQETPVPTAEEKEEKKDEAKAPAASPPVAHVSATSNRAPRGVPSVAQSQAETKQLTDRRRAENREALQRKLADVEAEGPAESGGSE